MSKNKRALLGQGLLVGAWVGVAFAIGAGADEPVPQGRASAPLKGAGPDRFLLMTDGRLVRGVISHEDSAYTVTQKIGVIRFPDRQVERAFDSVEEAYRYRLERIPEEDPAERLRLARWCLSLNLNKEAKMLLEQVVEISPEHGPARAMLTKITQSEAARIAQGEAKVDDELKKTGGEEISEDRPGALDSAVLRGAGQRMGITGLPVIFDLPPMMAIQRAEQFTKNIHPVLQAYCAKCHNPEYDGSFQLVPVKNPRQRNPDAVRANLDATLRLIDRESPAKSELLSSTLRPHGIAGKRRPIFSGSNDRAYQILASWVTSLGPQAGAEPMSRGTGSASEEMGEAFATERNRSGAEVVDDVARGSKLGNPRQPSTTGNPSAQGPAGRSYRYMQGQGMVPEDPRQADPQEFPLPYMMGGPRPVVPGGASAKGNGLRQQAASNEGADPVAPRAMRSKAEARSDEPEDVSLTSKEIPKPRDGSGANPTAPKKKPLRIDPKILEKFLQPNANRPPAQ